MSFSCQAFTRPTLSVYVSDNDLQVFPTPSWHTVIGNRQSCQSYRHAILRLRSYLDDQTLTRGEDTLKAVAKELTSPALEVRLIREPPTTETQECREGCDEKHDQELIVFPSITYNKQNLPTFSASLCPRVPLSDLINHDEWRSILRVLDLWESVGARNRYRQRDLTKEDQATTPLHKEDEDRAYRFQLRDQINETGRTDDPPTLVCEYRKDELDILRLRPDTVLCPDITTPLQLRIEGSWIAAQTKAVQEGTSLEAADVGSHRCKTSLNPLSWLGVQRPLTNDFV